MTTLKTFAFGSCAHFEVEVLDAMRVSEGVSENLVFLSENSVVDFEKKKKKKRRRKKQMCVYVRAFVCARACAYVHLRIRAAFEIEMLDALNVCEARSLVE